MRRTVSLCALLLLSACIVRLDEDDVFRPVAFDAALARKSGERMIAERAFLSEDAWIAAWHARAAADELPASPAPFIPAAVEHAYLSPANSGLAWTSVSRLRPATSKADDRLIVRCGGNTSTRQRSGYRYTLAALAYGDVLLFDYPGYGESRGEADAAGFRAMLADLADLVRERAEGRQVVLWGHSLGGLVCAELSRVLPETDAVILETSAPNARETAEAWTPWYAAPFVRIVIPRSLADFDAAAALGEFGGPVLVMGAARDRVLPVSLSRSLYEALKDGGRDVTYIEFAGGGHTDLMRQADFAPALTNFFARLSGAD
jgi:pimeloyl-ACP methyl ester carboxylesterase